MLEGWNHGKTFFDGMKKQYSNIPVFHYSGIALLL
jgi:hypothetical protein